MVIPPHKVRAHAVASAAASALPPLACDRAGAAYILPVTLFEKSTLIGGVVEGIAFEVRPALSDLLGDSAWILAEFQSDRPHAASGIETGFDDHSVFQCKVLLFSLAVIHCGTSFLPQTQCCCNDNLYGRITED